MASDRLTPGLSAEIETVVDDKLVVKHMGGEGVLSTPSMIGLMERAGIQAVQAHLPEGPYDGRLRGQRQALRRHAQRPEGHGQSRASGGRRPQASLQGRGARRAQEGRRGHPSQGDHSGAEEGLSDQAASIRDAFDAAVVEHGRQQGNQRAGGTPNSGLRKPAAN